MTASRLATLTLVFLAGLVSGGYLFADSRPRSFLALAHCGSCYRPNDLAGLLASVAIERAPFVLPRVVKESDRCIAIAHPFARPGTHFVLVPKRDIKDIADVAQDDQPYVLDCLAMIRSLVIEHGLRSYRVETNGPDLQDVTYLHFHLLAKEGRSAPSPGGGPSPGTSPPQRPAPATRRIPGT